MNPLTEEMLAEIHSHRDADRAKATKRYFREPIESLGLSMSRCMEIAAYFYPKVKSDLPLALEVVGELHDDGVFEVEKSLCHKMAN